MRNKYNLVDTVEKLKQLDKFLMNGKTPNFNTLAYDTETNGLHIHESTVVGFSLSTDAESGWYIPLLTWERDPSSKKTKTVKGVKYECFTEGKLKCVWTGAKFDEFVKPEEYNIQKRFPLIPGLLKKWFKDAKLIMHNAPFDVNMTHKTFGVDLKNNVFADTALLLHILDENNSVALKKAAERYKDALGINPHVQAAMEKKELDTSIIESGGTPGQVWRATLDYQSKYACADTFLTYGIFQVAIKEFAAQFGKRGLNWYFNQEVMPVCKEVVIDMKQRGVFVDVPYFERIHKETQQKMMDLEDEIMDILDKNKYLQGFNVGKSIDEEISDKALLTKIIELEGRSIPTKTNKAGETKETLAKGEVKKVYAEDPHWVWGYILGEDEIKYSDEKIAKIKKSLYVEKMNKGREAELKPLKRYRFNIGSTMHLRWLFCDKLGVNPKKLPQTASATPDNPLPQLSADVLEEHMLPKWSWVAKLLSYKRLLKLESTYIRPALILQKDGWIYMDMKQNGTTSGRFSCSGGYNLQTLPRVDDEMEILEACDCGSTDVEIVQSIECMADRKCNTCGKIKTDIARPSSIKQGFIAPPGYKIINADYSSLEPRCFAFMSGEPALKDVYLKGLDLYSQVYCQLFDKEGMYSADPNDENYLKKKAKHLRTFIKPIVLGIPYGAEDAQVANLIGAQREILDKKTGELRMIPDVEKGKAIRDQYLNTFKALNKYMEDADLKATSLGYVETIVGRRRHLPYAKQINDILDSYGVSYKSLKDAKKNQLNAATVTFVDKSGIKVTLTEEALNEICDVLKIKSDKLKEKGYWAYIRALLKGDLNNAKNNPIQGLAGSIANAAMLDVNRAFRQNNLDAWVMLQVHDEISCYVKEDQAELGAKLLQKHMEKNWVTNMIDIPMIADPVIASNLKDAK